MTKAKVYPAGPPVEGQWVVQWQSPAMAAPAFWYYATEAEALAQARALRSGGASSTRRGMIGRATLAVLTTRPGVPMSDSDAVTTAAQDLITDLLHLCEQATGQNESEPVLGLALMHYEAERTQPLDEEMTA